MQTKFAIQIYFANPINFFNFTNLTLCLPVHKKDYIMLTPFFCLNSLHQIFLKF